MGWGYRVNWNLTLAGSYGSCSHGVLVRDKSALESRIKKSGLRMWAEDESQAIMDYLGRLPIKKAGELPVILVNARSAEVRAIKVGQ